MNFKIKYNLCNNRKNNQNLKFKIQINKFKKI